MRIVRTISPNEKLVHQVGDTKFFYRRVPTEDATAIRRSCTTRGELDGGKASMLILRKYLIGWKNVQDWDGNEVPFTSDNISLIPDQVLAEIITVISSAEGQPAESVDQAMVARGDKIVKNS